MHRKILKNLLEKYNPTYAEERVAKQQMLDFIDTCANCFERSCVVGHFTASSWLVSSDFSKVLLMHHKKLNRWLQLGGHCDGDSDVTRVSIKEAQEESGIDNIVLLQENIFDIDIHLIPQIRQELPHYHFDVRFLLKVEGDDTVTINHESNHLKWFDAETRTFPTSNPSVLRMLDKWKSSCKNF